MTTTELVRAREAFSAQSWATAFACFDELDHAVLDATDLELFARSAFLLGREDDCVRLLERAYHRRLDADEAGEAAECAFWLAFNLMNRGEMAQAGGWLARAGELSGAMPADHPVRGLLLVPAALQALMEGDAARSRDLFGQAHEVGRASRQPELLALSTLGTGQALISAGDVDTGLRKLDEVMVAVTAGEVSPIVSGVVYCAVIIACHDTYQIRRAAEWTRALSRWCEDQPDLVPFRGQCLVHRAQLLLLNGDWREAAEQVQLACIRLSDPPGQPAVGMAFYEQGELLRLRGEHAAAEDAYRQAGACGHEIQPGMALLRLAQGNRDAAQSGLRRALGEARMHRDRPRLLAAQVDVALAGSDVAAARAAADELARIADESGAMMLRAMARQATGTVLLAEGDPGTALRELRAAYESMRELDAPYLAARIRVLLGRCCAELGDVDTARIERDAAGSVFRELAATADLAALEAGSGAGDGPLTTREVQVLRAVATGKTNRAVAEELFLSEKTVARHISNIFTKLALSSRSAATAYAYEHDLV